MKNSFLADLHIHSHYSRATSKDLTPEHLWVWAQKKGISVVGTGDFTHAGWLSELEEKLEPAGNGLFRLKPELAKNLRSLVPKASVGEVFFVLSSEISNIYKHKGRVRKIHNVILADDFEAVRNFNEVLGKRGNLEADGRPILGITAKELLEISLENIPNGIFIPAHVWTPWFSLFGSRSGYDSIEECFEELTEHIWALETGLSSDPPMNWRLSALDRFLLVSNSDAHSPSKLGREANLFECELSYESIRHALKTGNGFVGTVEFFPEEGKYHLDGHRKCGIRLSPKETIQLGGVCPVCGGMLTVGVLHRVEELADREDGFVPNEAKQFQSLIPLPEIISEIKGKGVNTKTVRQYHENLLSTLGDEFSILTRIPLEDIERATSGIFAEAISRMRQGKVVKEAGFDGEYGKIHLFEPGEIDRLSNGVFSFVQDLPYHTKKDSLGRKGDANAMPQETAFENLPLFGTASSGEHQAEQSKPNEDLPVYLQMLDSDQRKCVQTDSLRVVVQAGPGTGKTRVLVARIAREILEGNTNPSKMVAITFTRKAANQLRERIESFGLPGDSLFVGTFHAFGLMLLRSEPERFGLEEGFGIASSGEVELLLGKILDKQQGAGSIASKIALAKSKYLDVSEFPEEIREVAEELSVLMQRNNLVDLPDLIRLPVAAMVADEDYARMLGERFESLFIDEYQDVSPMQHRLIMEMLLNDSVRLFAIGDKNQSIYGFRGAGPQLIDELANADGVERFSLKRNFRSGVHVVELGNRILDEQVQVAASGGGNAALHPMIYSAATDRAEAEFIAHTIERMLGGTSYFSLDSGRSAGIGSNIAPSDIAVLYRTKAQAELIHAAISALGLPVMMSSGDDIHSNVELAGLITALRRWYGGSNSSGEDEWLPFYSLPRYSPEIELSTVLHILTKQFRLPESIESFLMDSAKGILAADAEQFLADILISKEIDTLSDGVDAVNLMTIHASKGLEFPVVILAGAEDGLLPLFHADIDEERRLFYVAITRAIDMLIITWARKRLIRGVVCKQKLSPFVDSIESMLAQHEESNNKKKKKPSTKDDPELPFL